MFEYRYRGLVSFHLVLVIIAGAIMLISCSSSTSNPTPQATTGPTKAQILENLTQEERIQLMYEYLNEAVQNKATLEDLLNSEEFSRLVNEAGLLYPQSQDDAVRFFRSVEVDVVLRLNVEEWVKYMNFDELPDQYAYLFESSGDGMVKISQGRSTFYPAILMDNFVITSDTFFKLAPSKIRESMRDEFTHRQVFVVRTDANKSLGDLGRERLLDGTGTNVEVYTVIFDSIYDIVFFQRPSDRFMVQAPLYDESEIASDLKEEEPVAISRKSEGSATSFLFSWSKIFSISGSGTFLVEGVFSDEDLGSPMFALRGGEFVFAGMVIEIVNENQAIVIDAETLLKRLEIAKRNLLANED